MNKKEKVHVWREGGVEISQNAEEERKSARKNLTVNYAGCLFI